MGEALAIICVLVWVYLIGGRGAFWLGRVRDTGALAPEPHPWPSVVAVVPARNKSENIAISVQSLLRQDYAGSFSIIVVDDDSNDGTAAVAARAAEAVPQRAITVVRSKGASARMDGKIMGGQARHRRCRKIAAGISPAHRCGYCACAAIRLHVAREAVGCRTVCARPSLMAKLRCESLAERSHVPAFIYFFQMLFPFPRVCRATSSVAAAAGGCMLIRADALASAGGIASIRNALIDDCSLAATLKKIGPIWLGLTDRVRSIRPYDTLSDVKRMISRSAYAQLRYSPLLLAATTASMAVTFIAPPLLAIFATGLPRFWV